MMQRQQKNCYAGFVYILAFVSVNFPFVHHTSSHLHRISLNPLAFNPIATFTTHSYTLLHICPHNKMGLTYRNGVSIAEIIVYVPSLAIAIFLCVRHGFARSSGWMFL